MAHSTTYGVGAHRATWLKCCHPAEFMAAVLTTGKGFYHLLVYVLESYRLGLKFLPPIVNEPGPRFAVHGSTIRVPLTATKGLSDKSAKRIIAERERDEFKSVADFHRRANPSHDEMEAIIRAGGFDEFGQPRARQFWEARYLHQTFGSSAASDQGWLLPPPSFGFAPG